MSRVLARFQDERSARDCMECLAVAGFHDVNLHMEARADETTVSSDGVGLESAWVDEDAALAAMMRQQQAHDLTFQ